MTISLYHASVPVFLRGLDNLEAVLRKAQAHAAEKQLDPAALLSARLAPDMFDLTRQVQSACDAAKAGTARLAGQTPPSFADTETTFAELFERIAKTVAFIKSVPASDIDGHEDRVVTLKMRGGEVSFAPVPYLLSFVLPNFYFHLTTAYGVMRHYGVQLGKLDYLGTLPPPADWI
ncbi:DUF1993 domain-containing protein [Amantichitinum ursilacus]|uniref:DUF1993 domain-containing protein n=1 Tax=Amantichitinum ursilacus TaxID=857265 RepID=A0A0N0GL82_9NEIS|nr:DUF1993 domain-containing protein [Amantichitinum ursilacus]KPC49686.1 hypothetical protein WG78_20225 [Amantichitinum ursilacus]